MTYRPPPQHPKATRKASAEDVSGDEGTYDKSTGLAERKKIVRVVSSDIMTNESVGNTQVVSAVNTRSRAKRHLSAAPPDHAAPIAQDGRASRGGAHGRAARGRSRRRRGGAGRGGESHARDKIGDTIDEARTTNEPNGSLIVRLQMDREKLKQVTATTARNPAELRPLATQAQSDFRDEFQVGAGTEAQADAGQAIIRQDDTNTMHTSATISNVDDLAVPSAADNSAATAIDSRGPTVADSAGAPSISVDTRSGCS